MWEAVFRNNCVSYDFHFQLTNIRIVGLAPYPNRFVSVNYTPISIINICYLSLLFLTFQKAVVGWGWG